MKLEIFYFEADCRHYNANIAWLPWDSMRRDPEDYETWAAESVITKLRLRSLILPLI